MSASPIRTAIFNQLNGDPALSALVGSRIFYQVAPQSATFPLVVFQKQSGTPRWTMQGTPVQDDLWAVKGIGTGDQSATDAESIAAAIDDALNDADLTITGKEALFLLRESDIDFAEDQAGELYRHVGGLYRLSSE